MSQAYPAFLLSSTKWTKSSFTTKEVGTGTGLGLAMVYGAVSQNGGRIEVSSELGHGTTFRIYLPRVQGAVPSTENVPSKGPPRGSETIVVVEDDAKVRALVVMVLERHGYVVHAFSDGFAALNAVREMTEPIHLLLTDVIMPGMNGRVLADEIIAIRPTVKVLFTSGYTANIIVQHGVLEEGTQFLAKPYTATALAQSVRDLLHARSAEPGSSRADLVRP